MSASIIPLVVDRGILPTFVSCLRYGDVNQKSQPTRIITEENHNVGGGYLGHPWTNYWRNDGTNLKLGGIVSALGAGTRTANEVQKVPVLLGEAIKDRVITFISGQRSYGNVALFDPVSLAPAIREQQLMVVTPKIKDYLPPYWPALVLALKHMHYANQVTGANPADLRGIMGRMAELGPDQMVEAVRLVHQTGVYSHLKKRLTGRSIDTLTKLCMWAANNEERRTGEYRSAILDMQNDKDNDCYSAVAGWEALLIYGGAFRGETYIQDAAKVVRLRRAAGRGHGEGTNTWREYAQTLLENLTAMELASSLFTVATVGGKLAPDIAMYEAVRQAYPLMYANEAEQVPFKLERVRRSRAIGWE